MFLKSPQVHYEPLWHVAVCNATCPRSGLWQALSAVQLASSDLAEVPCLRRIHIAIAQKNVPSNKGCCADFMPATQCTNLVNLLGKFSVETKPIMKENSLFDRLDNFTLRVVKSESFIHLQNGNIPVFPINKSSKTIKIYLFWIWFHEIYRLF